MANSDVIDVLTRQHDEIRRLGEGVRRSGADGKGRLFAEFGDLVRRHELGDRQIVHPAVRNTGAPGDETGAARTAEEGGIDRALGELAALGTRDPSFDGKFEALRLLLSDHNEHEEREEFPLLRRYLTASRLHMMAGELHDLQVMAAR